MNSGGFIGGLYVLSEWIMRFSFVNLLWIIFNFPIVFIFLNMLFSEQVEMLFLYIISLVILSPILLFPATMAMFASVREWIVKKESNGRLLSSFLHYYKENYNKSFLGGIIFSTVWMIWTADVYYLNLMNLNMILIPIFVMLGIGLYVWTINFFSVAVHYHLGLFMSLKNAFLISLGSPILFISVIISSVVILYISINIIQPLMIFFTCSLIAFLSFYSFHRNYLKLINGKRSGVQEQSR